MPAEGRNTLLFRARLDVKAALAQAAALQRALDGIRASAGLSTEAASASEYARSLTTAAASAGRLQTALSGIRNPFTAKAVSNVNQYADGLERASAAMKDLRVAAAEMNSVAGNVGGGGGGGGGNTLLSALLGGVTGVQLARGRRQVALAKEQAKVAKESTRAARSEQAAVRAALNEVDRLQFRMLKGRKRLAEDREAYTRVRRDPKATEEELSHAQRVLARSESRQAKLETLLRKTREEAGLTTAATASQARATEALATSTAKAAGNEKERIKQLREQNRGDAQRIVDLRRQKNALDAKDKAGRRALQTEINTLTVNRQQRNVDIDNLRSVEKESAARTAAAKREAAEAARAAVAREKTRERNARRLVKEVEAIERGRERAAKAEAAAERRRERDAARAESRERRRRERIG